MNRITVVGRLTRDPESADYNGQNIVKFGVAANNRIKKKEGGYEANFYNCSIWGNRGDTITKYFKKGDQIALTGELVVRQYVGNDGTPKTSVDITVDNFDFVGNRQQDTTISSQSAAPAPSVSKPAPADGNDDLPF